MNTHNSVLVIIRITYPLRRSGPCFWDCVQAAKSVVLSSAEEEDDEGAEGLREEYHNVSEDETHSVDEAGLVGQNEETGTGLESDSTTEHIIEKLADFNQHLLAEVNNWFEPSTRPFKVAT